MYLIYKICKYHKLLKKTFPQYMIDGSRNIWIVKPSYNARGFGIYLIDSMKEIIQNGRKSQQKIVQKYIERPFLLKIKSDQFPQSHMLSSAMSQRSPRVLTPNTQTISLRKFDIRQWVLITSFDPLIIYTFSDFYLRICSSEFNLHDIGDAFKHLSNYTINKTNQKGGMNRDEELAMSQDQFIEYLKTHCDPR